MLCSYRTRRYLLGKWTRWRRWPSNIALPAISQMPRFDETGGLLWYGADVLEMFRHSATHVDKILKGAKPAELPVEQPTKVGLVVNPKTARALSVTIPLAIMVRADRVIN
jgi:putative tryptophan/tyrosine transport system substrate-binding protein